MSIETEVIINGVEYPVRISHFVPPHSGRYQGDPNSCYPAESGEVEFEVLGDNPVDEDTFSLIEAELLRTGTRRR